MELTGCPGLYICLVVRGASASQGDKLLLPIVDKYNQFGRDTTVHGFKIRNFSKNR